MRLNLLFILWIIGNGLLAQDFIPIDEKLGLSEKEIYGIEEDDKGVIWLASKNGLVRYDGYSFEYKFHEKQNGLSIFHFDKDQQGRIWFTNLANQLFYIQNDSVKHFGDYYNFFDGDIIWVTNINDDVYLNSYASFLKINLKTKKVTKGLGKSIMTFIKFNDFIYTTKKEGKQKKIIKFNDELSKEVITFDEPSIREIYPIVIEDKMLFYVNLPKSGKVFFLVDADDSVVKIENSIGNIRIVGSDYIDGKIYLFTEKGIYVCEITDNKLIVNNALLEGDFTTCFLKDRQGNHWVSTLTKGLFIKPFNAIKKIPLNRTKRLVKGEDNRLFLITQEGQIFHLLPNDSIREIKHLNKGVDIQHFVYNKLKKEYLIGYENKGNLTLDSDLNQLLSTNVGFDIKDITCFDSTIAIATNLDFTINKKSYSLNNHRKNVLFYDKSRSIATEYCPANQSVYYSTPNGFFKVNNQYEKRLVSSKLKNNTIMDIAILKDSLVCALSSKGGLFVFYNDTLVNHFNAKNGLLSNINTLIKTNGNYLWIAGLGGVQRLDYSAKKFQNYTIRDGLNSLASIGGLEMVGNKTYVATSKGVFVIDSTKTKTSIDLNPYFKSIKTNKRQLSVTDEKLKLAYQENSLKISFNTNGYLSKDYIQYEYRIPTLDSKWEKNTQGINEVNLKGVPVGDFIFELRAIEGSVKSAVLQLKFHKKNIFYKTIWFSFFVGFWILGLVILFFVFRARRLKKKQEERLEAKKRELENVELKLESLRSQMNPHFIFNSLNSIQDLILLNKTSDSYDTVVVFSKLIRNALEYSQKEFITLKKEMEFLSVYLSLEKLRFGDDFDYKVTGDLDNSLKIPSLIIQPFVENALVHGLMHKEGEKKLRVIFEKHRYVICHIIDNGIGREEAMRIKQRQQTAYESFSTRAIRERLAILSNKYGFEIGYEYEDLYENGQPAGTKATVRLPFREF